jgi:predicted hydrolase (HD superfamily)
MELAMLLTHDQAPQQLRAWTTNPSLLGHAQAVEIVMRAAASEYGGDPEIWGITGLLHDADYDQWPEDHPKRIVDWLREQIDPDRIVAAGGSAGGHLAACTAFAPGLEGAGEDTK